MSNTEHALIVIDPKLEVQRVVINVAQGTIWATPNGGALRTPQNTLVRWECQYPFTISFTQLGGSDAPWGELSSHPEPGDIQAIEVKPRQVPPGAQPPFYEYTVRVGRLTLDPIIIVDKN